MFSKRAAAIDVALAASSTKFAGRGLSPVTEDAPWSVTPASADTRSRKSDPGAPNLATRWQGEAP